MPESLLRTQDGAVVKEGLYLQDYRDLYKVSTVYEGQVALIICLDRGELTDRTRVRNLVTDRVRDMRVANQGLIDRYHALLDAAASQPGPLRPHGFTENPAGGGCKSCGLSRHNPVHEGEGPL